MKVSFSAASPAIFASALGRPLRPPNGVEGQVCCSWRSADGVTLPSHRPHGRMSARSCLSRMPAFRRLQARHALLNCKDLFRASLSGRLSATSEPGRT